ncbi:MAG: SDR family oxidoreductase [Saprospiraceae bacterium]
MSFKNKVVWITGASSGIGEHLAYTFAAEGAKLVISSRNKKELERVKQNCKEETEIMILPMDVADFDSIPAKAQTVLDHFGFINILINSAGISQRSLIQETDFSVDKKIIEVNYLGTVAVTKAVLPAMIRQQFGHIVVISSVMGKLGVPWRSAYAASKHALHGYFDALRGELEAADIPIHITILIPGYVQSNATINALKGDGSKNNTVSEANRNGMDPEVFAKKALAAISAGKREVAIGGKEVFSIYVKRFFPAIVARSLKKIRLS